MKITHKKIEKDGEGNVGLIAEEADDLWNIYNFIQKNDQIRCSTFRKLVKETSTGSTDAHRVKITLTLLVERVEFDTESNVIKVKGKSVEENKYVRRGQYHTLSIELNKKFYLTKPVWDSLAWAQLYNFRDAAHSAEVAVVIMQEGLGFVCLLTSNMTIQKAKIEVNIPRKRKNFCSQHQKGLEEFYEQILQAMLRHIKFDVIKCVVVASPGFIRDQFAEYMWQVARKNDIKPLLDSREKFLLAHSSSGFKHSIREVLSDPLIQPKLEDTKAVQEVKIWNQFQDLLSTAPNKAVYGLRDVETANHYKAISCLLLTDTMFRSNNLALRKKYSKLLHEVRSYGGDVRIFSSMHLSGVQLSQLTGIGALLKFEVPELSERISGFEADGKRVGNEDSSNSSSSSSSSCSSSSSSSSACSGALAGEFMEEGDDEGDEI